MLCREISLYVPLSKHTLSQISMMLFMMDMKNGRIPSEFRAFINELGYKHTNNSRQNLLNINNLLKTARHNFITGKAPIGDI